jgi:hypothetical protein
MSPSWLIQFFPRWYQQIPILRSENLLQRGSFYLCFDRAIYYELMYNWEAANIYHIPGMAKSDQEPGYRNPGEPNSKKVAIASTTKKKLPPRNAAPIPFNI